MELSEFLKHLPRINIRFRDKSSSRIQGYHPGRSRGFDEERNDYRLYSPGDDLRYLDWRLLARTDKLYLREGLKHEKQKVIIWLDLSHSMEQPADRLETAIMTALGLAGLLLKQHDSVFLHCDQMESNLYPIKKIPDLFALEQLIRNQKDKIHRKNLRNFSSPRTWYPTNGNYRVLLITDFYMSLDNSKLISETMAQLRAGLSLLHLVHESDTRKERERNFFSGFVDSESGAFLAAERIADKNQIFTEAIRARRQNFTRYGFPVYTVNAEKGPLQILHSFQHL